MIKNMQKKIKSPEIMSPAGDFACLDAALDGGADAVYFGLRGTNMRAGAKNFTIPQMSKLADICRNRGAKSYLTLNTIYYQGQIRELRAQIKAAKRAGVDAVIAWDFSVIEAANELGMPIFLSTQASVSNAAAVAALHEKFGIERFVLARECDMADIPRIRKDLKSRLGSAAKKIRLEVFAHGAMCVSVSGRCFLSQFSCGKSANRGECAQPCRKEYSVYDSRSDGSEFLVGNGYVMSPKDLCTLGFIEKLIDAGVDSLKIEGRSRNAEYVYTSTQAYVRARDFYVKERGTPDFDRRFAELKTALISELSTVFNRGFSDGFYMGKPVGDWTSDGNKSTMKKVIVGKVDNYFSRSQAAEISVNDRAVSIGDEIQFEGKTTGFFRMKIDSMQSLGESILSAPKGSKMAVKVSERVRRGDLVYKFVKS